MASSSIITLMSGDQSLCLAYNLKVEAVILVTYPSSIHLTLSHQFTHLSRNPSLYLTTYLLTQACTHPFIDLSLSILCLSIHPLCFSYTFYSSSYHPSITCLSVYLPPKNVYICPLIYHHPSIYLPTRPSIHYLHIYPSIHSSIHQSIC